MSILANVIRPLWLRGLNDISGMHIKGIDGWICDEEYQIYTPVTLTSFALNVANPEPLLEAYASEINRIAVASFETPDSIVRLSTFPKSTAWLVIKTYYAAFFAAHAFIRMLGTSCSILDREQVKSIATVASLYNNSSSQPMRGGLYRMTFNPTASQLEGVHIKNVAAGPHEAFWLVFQERIERLSSEVLTTGVDTIANRQLVSSKLSELASNLSFASSGKGRWLSAIRNSVNYYQKHSTWYPYAGQKSYYQQLFDKKSEWKADPIELDLTSHTGKDLRRFQVTCNFIVGMLRTSIAEMARRCSAGKSFHTYGSVAFLNLLQQRTAVQVRK
jgi:hypothetical protein